LQAGVDVLVRPHAATVDAAATGVADVLQHLHRAVVQTIFGFEVGVEELEFLTGTGQADAGAELGVFAGLAVAKNGTSDGLELVVVRVDVGAGGLGQQVTVETAHHVGLGVNKGGVEGGVDAVVVEGVAGAAQAGVSGVKAAAS